MATINKDTFSGGADLATGELAKALQDIADDLTELRTHFIAVLGKLDDDSGLDASDYVSTQSPAALKTIKGTTE